jgi:secondary thiamine-phosphate synthase enzyme
MLKTISVKTSAQTEMVDVTSQVQSELSKSGIIEGRLTLYVPHTTAAITINEGADPAVKADILMVLNQMVPARVWFWAPGREYSFASSTGREIVSCICK